MVLRRRLLQQESGKSRSCLTVACRKARSGAASGEAHPNLRMSHTATTISRMMEPAATSIHRMHNVQHAGDPRPADTETDFPVVDLEVA
ncbi:hypothetical protein B0G81_0918 [Paraburkholderia sp. BL6665CI2N2]|nr:hypothetical protein B0G81_0918 [Paraburkholderia sp. BL6665CI2N2]